MRCSLATMIVLLGFHTLGAIPAMGAPSINLSAAISLKDALGDAAKAYEASTGVHVELTLGASGRLATQILEGSPTDLFISADEKHANDLLDAHLIKVGTTRVIARNALVLIVPADATSPITSFEQLADPQVKRLAIGEPKTVPAGEYAMQVLKALKLQDAVASRLVYGSNVRQVLTYVEGGEVTAGIVYATDAMDSGKKVKVVAKADPATHQPIAYYAAPILSGRQHEPAEKFIDYLLGPQGHAALAAHGFLPPQTPTTAPARATP
jgi:molybdate transport system substrate-binding protein